MALEELLAAIRAGKTGQPTEPPADSILPPAPFKVPTATAIGDGRRPLPEAGVPFKPGVTEADVAASVRGGRATTQQGRARAALFEGIDTSLPEPTGSILEAGISTPAQVVIGAQAVLPFIRGKGFEEYQRLRAEGMDIGNAIAQAYQAQDLPSARVNILPGQGIPLPFDKRLDEVDIGVKGGIELVAQPDIIGGLAGFGARRFATAAGQALLPETQIARAAAKAAGEEIAEDLVALGGRYAAQNNPTVRRFARLLGDAKPTRAETEVLKSAVLKKKAARIQKVLDGTPDIRDAVKRARAARAGELPRGDFEAIVGKLSDDEVDTLLTIVRDNPDLLPFERVRAWELIDPTDVNSVINGKLPTLGEIGLLEQVFGDDVVKSLLKKVPVSSGAKVRDTVMEILNAPRTAFSSLDLSAPGRQAAPALAANPRKAAGAFHAQLQAWGSEANAIKVNRTIVSHPDAQYLQRAGVFLAEVTSPRSGTRLRFNPKTGQIVESSTLLAREEAFMSGILQKLPVVGRGIRASERAYITYLNKIRADIFYGTLTQWRSAGKSLTDDNLRQLGELINNLTGRGSLDFGRIITLESARPLLSAIFFSPGLQASRLQLAASLFDPTLDSGVRRQLYKNVASGLALGTAVLGAMKAAGAEVETDPRSTDFGRAKIGQTRLDFWGGFQPYARFAVQMWTQESKSASGDIRNLREEYGTTRWDQAGRFARSKLAPGASIIVDALEGETYLGEDPMSGENVANTMVPGAFQDLWDAMREQGAVSGFALGLPAFLGIGVNSYSTTGDLYNAAAAKFPDEEGNVGRRFAELSRAEQEVIRKDPEIAARAQELQRPQDDQPLAIVRQVVFEQNERFRADAESDILRRVLRGLDGNALREAIQDFNRDRYVASTAVFEPYRDRLFRLPSVHKDVLAQEYWTAPIGLNEDGSLNFDARDIARQDVLARATASRIDTNYITGTGKGTWRGDLSDNSRLNDLLTNYNRDMETLRAYWSVGDDPNYAGFANRALWQRYLEGSDAERRELARGSQTIKRALRKQSDERTAMREQDATVDTALVRWFEYLGQTPQGRLLYNRLYVEGGA